MPADLLAPLPNAWMPAITSHVIDRRRPPAYDGRVGPNQFNE